MSLQPVRSPAVAGTFYPKDPVLLRRMVGDLLGHAAPPNLRPKALIVPHAGYIYSGETAAVAYKTLAPYKDVIRRVVLLGPSHRVAFDGIASPGCTAFVTPLGSVTVDKACLDGLRETQDVKVRQDAHLWEHSLEVQVPFLQMVLGDFDLLPLVVGDTDGQQVASVLAELWGGEDTLVVVSTDLSHFHSYEDAKFIDAATVQEIEHLNPVLRGEQACGCRPLNGLLIAAKARGMQIHTLDVRNSGDTAGDKDRVVGYGAFALV